MTTNRRGQYFVVRTHGALAWLIRTVLRSDFNHAGICTDEYGNIIEAKAKGACLGNVHDYDEDTIAFSDFPLTLTERAEITRQAFQLLGRPYGFMDLIWLGLLQFGVKLNSIYRAVEDDRDLVCSQVVAECYFAAGIRLSNNEWCLDVTPGDLAKRIGLRTP